MQRRAWPPEPHDLSAHSISHQLRKHESRRQERTSSGSRSVVCGLSQYRRCYFLVSWGSPCVGHDRLTQRAVDRVCLRSIRPSHHMVVLRQLFLRGVHHAQHGRAACPQEADDQDGGDHQEDDVQYHGVARASSAKSALVARQLDLRQPHTAFYWLAAACSCPAAPPTHCAMTVLVTMANWLRRTYKLALADLETIARASYPALMWPLARVCCVELGVRAAPRWHAHKVEHSAAQYARGTGRHLLPGSAISFRREP